MGCKNFKYFFGVLDIQQLVSSIFEIQIEMLVRYSIIEIQIEKLVRYSIFKFRSKFVFRYMIFEIQFSYHRTVTVFHAIMLKTLPWHPENYRI